MSLVCPKCGSSMFLRVFQVRGSWEELIDGEGDTVDTNLDGLKYGPPPKWLRCAEDPCKGRVINPSHQAATIPTEGS